MPDFDVAAIRKQFPALDKKPIYFDNAGGSQILGSVADSIATYLTTTNVQLGASYPISQASTHAYSAAHSAVAKYLHTTPDNIVLGPSTTQLFRNLSQALFDYLDADSEVILSQLDHEANISAWLQIAKWKGCTVKWWKGESVGGNASNPQHTTESLRKLMSSKTKFVACTHVSNVLGTIHDVKALAEVVHEVPGAMFCVDGVAFAPHREVNVEDLRVDFYAFSWYKVYGPHIATLYGSAAARKNLTSLGHYFHGTETLTNQLGLAAASYELAASIPTVTGWLAQQSWEQIARHEEDIQKVLIDYLLSKPDLFTIYGEPTADRKKRVPVVTFGIKGFNNEDVVKKVEEKSHIGCRWGAFYSDRCVEEVLGIKDAGGVLRVSMVFYNTVEEVKQFVEVLDGIVSS
ncbi:unnamed protein product [Zymoseptoria tritici ST99CH_3D1]|nr:unnamed protein product [Zymoseptoria tritici ST99CH_3D1]